jgi:hypothetical protein
MNKIFTFLSSVLIIFSFFLLPLAVHAQEKEQDKIEREFSRVIESVVKGNLLISPLCFKPQDLEKLEALSSTYSMDRLIPLIQKYEWRLLALEARARAEIFAAEKECELRLKEKIKKKDPDSKKEADIATNYLGNGYCNQELLKNTLNKLREKGKAIEPKK